MTIAPRISAAVFAVACAAALAGQCGKKQAGPGDAVPDGYKSPYVPAKPETPAVPDVPAAAPAPEAQKSKVHPASAERPYQMRTAEEIATTPEAKEILGFLADPKQGGFALKRIEAGGAKGRELARKALLCSHRETRMQAALVLGNLKDGTKDTVRALMDAVLLDPDPDVRAVAAKAFISIHAQEAIPALIRSLKEDPFETARANAAWALGNIGTAAALTPLRDALTDDDTWVRLRAVSALKKMKARAAVPDLIVKLSDPNAMVRERAHAALKDITGKNAGPDPANWR